MIHDDPRVSRLLDEFGSGRLSRREVARRAATFGLSVSALRAIAGGAVAGAALAAPSFARHVAAQEGQGGVINVAQTGGDPGLGIPILVGATDNYPFWWAFERLVTYDDKGTPIPNLADSWEYNADGTQLTFKLAPTAKWHDGTPVTADDVLFTFDKIKDPAVKSDRGSRLQVGGEWVTWAAPDPQTVVISLPAPYAPFLFALSGIGIIPKHALEASADLNTDPFNLKPIGSGPYKIVEWQQDQFTRYERFDDYHRGRPVADGFNEVFFEDVQPALASLESGEIDVSFTPPESQPAYEDSDDFVLHRYVYYTPITLSFNHKHPILQDIKIRQAIRYAIDKAGLAEVVTKGRNTRADNQYADSGPLDRYNDYSLPKDEFSVEKANALLDEAGWLLNGDYREKDGERLSFSLLTYTGFEEYKNDLEILQEMLKGVGIEVKPEIIDYDALYARWADPDDDPITRALTVEEYPHPFEQDPDPYTELHSASFPPVGLNYNYIKDDEIDRLIEQGRTTTDDEQRIQIYHQLDARRKEVIPSVPLYLATDAWVFSRKVGGVPDDTPSSRWYLRCCVDKMYKTE